MNIQHLNEGLTQFYLVALAIVLVMAIIAYPSIKDRSKKHSR